MLRRSALLLLGLSLAGAALTYVASSSRPAEYETSTSIAALSAATGNTVLSTTLIAAPPLPQSVVQNALRSQNVLNLTITGLQRSALGAAEQASLTRTLRAESASGRYTLLRLLSSIDPQQQTGIYELRSHALSPQAAQVLADVSAQALLAWDRNRAAQNITRVEQTLRQQLANVDAQVAARPGDLEQRSLLSIRADLQQKLGQVSALLTAVSGTLSLISEAQRPTLPVAPKPLRDALLVFAGLLFFAALGAILLDSLRKRVTSAADLTLLGRPILGSLPRLGRRSAGLLSEAREGPLFESVGFLRVNLASLAPGYARLVISSAQPAEGKSTVTAALAQSIAMSGLRVLVVDADVYRPTQLKVWQQGGGQFISSVARSGGTLYTDVVRSVDLLIPEKAASDTASLSAMIDELAEQYAVVLVDTPPLLVVASTLELTARLDGLVMVVASGTELEQVERAMRNARTVGSQVLGLVLNKAQQTGTRYSYEEAYTLSPSVPDAAPLAGVKRE